MHRDNVAESLAQAGTGGVDSNSRVGTVLEVRMAKAAVSFATDLVEDVDMLRARHGDLERRLSELDRRRALTPAEQVERSELKKEKLRVKDRLAALGAI